jgi:DNA-binding transcriptional LysR family regulator
MDIRQLGRIDLNLLVALQALLEERNVSKAAERLFITQSAMSKTLGRLRTLFDDPLFTRTSSGVVPTPRAEALQLQLAAVLADVQGLVAADEFDPSAYQGEFTLIMPDYLGLLILPELMTVLQREAPGIHLQVISRAEHQLDQLASGDIDFVVQIEQHHYPAEFEVIVLGEATPVLVAREGHPLQGQDYSWEDVLKYPQLQLYIPDLEEADFFYQNPEVIERMSDLDPTLEIAHVFTALQVIRRTDFIMASPPMFTQEERLAGGVIALPMPEGDQFDLRYVMVAHQRIQRSLPHQYLMYQFLKVIHRYRASNDAPPLEGLGQNAELEVVQRLIADSN